MALAMCSRARSCRDRFGRPIPSSISAIAFTMRLRAFAKCSATLPRRRDTLKRFRAEGTGLSRRWRPWRLCLPLVLRIPRIPAQHLPNRSTHHLAQWWLEPENSSTYRLRVHRSSAAKGKLPTSEFLLQPDVRLLSLTGAGGTGKTRLAIAVASATAHHFTAGVQFVGLASISHADLVGTAVAKSLDIQQVSRRTVPQLLGDYLQDAGSFLLVLDNFEQVLPAATVVAEMLTACPNVKVMVTSRAGLRIYGEQEFPVAPLEQNSAVQLFAQRAAAVRPNFAITGENSAVIREICSKLDGLPLAIELAAARTKLLSPNAILERLQSRLQLLTGGALDLPERQQTLRNTIDWSHGLLNEAEQKLFRRFSAFVGGATLGGH